MKHRLDTLLQPGGHHRLRDPIGHARYTQNPSQRSFISCKARSSEAHLPAPFDVCDTRGLKLKKSRWVDPAAPATSTWKPCFLADGADIKLISAVLHSCPRNVDGDQGEAPVDDAICAP